MLYIEVIAENTLIIVITYKNKRCAVGSTYAKCLFLKGVYGVATVFEKC